MKRASMLGVVLLSLSLASVAEDSPKPVTIPVTIKGEVVDLHCHITRGASGEKHAGCAEACISRGVPAGGCASNLDRSLGEVDEQRLRARLEIG